MSKSKPFVCSSMKPASKSQQDEMRHKFNAAKCDRIFDYLLQEKQIKLSSDHVVPSLEHLKKHAYCKWHNSYSHATNDSNIFGRQVQSAINERRLKFAEILQMNLPFSSPRSPSPLSTLELHLHRAPLSPHLHHRRPVATPPPVAR
jgi:hypothetical protein